MQKKGVSTFLICLVLATPLKLKAESLYEVHPITDSVLITGTALGALVPELFASHLVNPRCPCPATEVNGFDRPVIGNHSHAADVVSDLTLGLSLGGPLLLDALLVGWSEPLKEDAIVYAETLAVTGALVSGTKFLVQRPIPRVYAGDPTLMKQSEGYLSFYSGHTTMAFSALSAAAVTSNLRYHTGVWPWLITGALGTSVAAERVLAGRHFYSDVIVGGVIGTAIGIANPLIHEKRSSDSLTVVPVSDGTLIVWTRIL